MFSNGLFLRRMLPEVKCFTSKHYNTLSRCKMCKLSVNNMIYYKFSHEAAFCVLSGKSIKVADLNFGCATFCALLSFDAVTTFSSNVKGSDIDMCSATYFLFDHNTKYCTIYLCPHTVVATV